MSEGHHCCEASFNPQKELGRLLLSIVIFISAMIFREELYASPYHIAEYAAFLSAYFLIGWKVVKAATKKIFKAHPFDENFLMVLATLGAFAIHELPEGVAVLLFFRLGEFFQDLAVNNSRRSIKSLLELRPDYANLKTDLEIVKCSPEEVQVGDHILIRPGEKIPLDGTVIDGYSQVDTSALTGESTPRSVKEGGTVLSGMINKTGLLTVVVTKRFADSSIAKILDLVENASQKKADTEKFITKLARIYTPIVVFAAVAVAVIPPLLVGGSWTEWIYRALVVLVISCPCGIVISIPLGYFAGIGGAAKQGILIKGAMFLDKLCSLKTVVFDKTGTLTKGNFKVTRIETRNGFSKNEIIAFAAKAEVHSNHPLAFSIMDAYATEIDASKVKDYTEVPAHGIMADVDGIQVMVGNDRFLHKEDIAHDTCSVAGTVAHVVINRSYAGYIIIADEVKDDALSAIELLRSLGVTHQVMLTGDSEAVAKRVATKLTLDHYESELLPEEKVYHVEKLLKEREGILAFVGDGINDAPVLTRADIGVAMGGLGSDAAIETADLVIMSDHPSKLGAAIVVAQKTRSIIWQNIAFAFLVKALFIVLGTLGDVNMWQAIFADVGVALIAILNASRVLRS